LICIIVFVGRIVGNRSLDDASENGFESWRRGLGDLDVGDGALCVGDIDFALAESRLSDT
jgi:hypothetical protein